MLVFWFVYPKYMIIIRIMGCNILHVCVCAFLRQENVSCGLFSKFPINPQKILRKTHRNQCRSLFTVSMCVCYKINLLFVSTTSSSPSSSIWKRDYSNLRGFTQFNEAKLIVRIMKVGYGAARALLCSTPTRNSGQRFVIFATATAPSAPLPPVE